MPFIYVRFLKNICMEDVKIFWLCNCISSLTSLMKSLFPKSYILCSSVFYYVCACGWKAPKCFCFTVYKTVQQWCMCVKNVKERWKIEFLSPFVMTKVGCLVVWKWCAITISTVFFLLCLSTSGFLELITNLLSPYLICLRVSPYGCITAWASSLIQINLQNNYSFL